MGVRKQQESGAQVQPTEGPKWAFGKVLRTFRSAKGISQETLAESAGLDRSFVSLVERGIQTPNIVVLLKIAKVLGVSAAAMISELEQTLEASELQSVARSPAPTRRNSRS